MAIRLCIVLFALVVALVPAAARAASHEPTQASPDCAAQAPIRLGGLDWESGQITTALLGILVREGLGCRTEVVPGSVPSLESALIQDDIQIIAEQWVGRSPGIEQAVRQNKVAIIGDTLTGGAVQGWYVPRYVQERHPDLTSVQDLARYAHLFPNPEQPGQARFLNCPAGWACETFNTRLLANTGLSARYANVHPGTGAALDAEIASAISRREPLLFYYWHPAGLMAKYDLVPIAFPEYDARCWPELMNAGSRDRCVSGFPVSRLAMAVSASLQKQYPQVVALIQKLQLPPEVLDRLILDMTENRRDGPTQARLFLQQRPDLWASWLPVDAARRVARRLGIDPVRLPGQEGGATTRSGRAAVDAASGRTDGKPTDGVSAEGAHPDTGSDTGADAGFQDPGASVVTGPDAFFPAWSVADWLNDSLARLVARHGEGFRAFSQSLLHGLLLPLERALGAVPPWLLLALLAGLAWHATRSLWSAAFSAAGFYLIGALGLWTPLLQTLALLVASFLFIIVVGFPLGILMARSRRLHRWLSPVLDIIQTMPSFVYLIPVLMLFGIGRIPALFATVVYATAPLVRLTALGIREVDARIVESAESFGCTRAQLLFWVLLPQARPAILAGINQAVMMSLGMVVVASMIGARGLGENVLQAIQTLDIGRGVQAGAAIVILAIVIDRVTQAYGRREEKR